MKMNSFIQDKKVLILGSSGFIGKHLFEELGKENAIATYHSRSIEGGIHFDALSMKLSDIVKNPSNISVAIILLGNTKIDSCAEYHSHC